jgi:hypothetical protein
MTELRQAMPLLARQEGIWEGWYRYYDAEGKQVDEHRSRLVCRLPLEGPVPYHQSNHYFWADGRKEVREFPATYRDGRLRFDNDLITGWAAEVSLDEHQRTLMLHWVRKGEPDVYLYEMIQVSDCGRYRTRVWQWISGGRTRLRTLIDEEKVSDSWEGY